MSPASLSLASSINRGSGNLRYPPVSSSVRQLEAQFSSCAVHPQGVDTVELRRIPTGLRIGLGDKLDLALKEDGGLLFYLQVKITAIRVLEREAVEFVASNRNRGPSAKRSFALLHVPRENTRLGRWPVLRFILSRPWKTLKTIQRFGTWIPPPAGRGVAFHPNPLRPPRLPVCVQQLLGPGPERPSAEEAGLLLLRAGLRYTVTVVRDDGSVLEAPLYPQTQSSFSSDEDEGGSDSV
ncbi:hypothetical protein C8Q77DRAFT_1157887 [Trametes polyzona]|nr:hypothetical protein C8Q77DRAFT_1157887 [Trametes polyzona]